MMRAFICSLVLVFALAVPADAADQFVSVIEDLPLIDGLIENENAAVTFEAAGGRIVEAEARGNIKPFDVVQFYDNVLPQLGWIAVDTGVFERESERLELDITEDVDGGAIIRFSISPIKGK